MNSTYKKEDVKILLKDITGLVEPKGTEEREALIQQGVHYSEMLPIEYVPSEKYVETYEQALENYSELTAKATAVVSEKIYRKNEKNIVLVSLARAGISAGVLIKHFLENKYKIKVYHYAISIIRGKGIDKNAMDYILKRHSPQSIQFVDGWVGKGAIQRQLEAALADYPDIEKRVAVLSDPGRIGAISGTDEDFIIASACLNSTVSGLISRTFYRQDIIKDNDFHGAVFYKELTDNDRTYEFIEHAEKYFEKYMDISISESENAEINGMKEVEEISEKFNISDINFIKPGIGETTRVLLRRLPWKVLVNPDADKNELGHIYQLAKEKGAAIEEYPLKCYKACGIIKKIADN